MKKQVTAFVAATMLAAVPLAASTSTASANHQFWHAVGKGVATGVGVGVGLGITNRIINGPPRQQQVIVQQPAPVVVQPAPQPVIVQGGFSQAHYNWCYSRYRSYHAPSNSFQPYSGPRRPCFSPYN